MPIDSSGSITPSDLPSTMSTSSPTPRLALNKPQDPAAAAAESPLSTLTQSTTTSSDDNDADSGFIQPRRRNNKGNASPPAASPPAPPPLAPPQRTPRHSPSEAPPPTLPSLVDDEDDDYHTTNDNVPMDSAPMGTSSPLPDTELSAPRSASPVDIDMDAACNPNVTSPTPPASGLRPPDERQEAQGSGCAPLHRHPLLLFPLPPSVLPLVLLLLLPPSPAPPRPIPRTPPPHLPLSGPPSARRTALRRLPPLPPAPARSSSSPRPPPPPPPLPRPRPPPQSSPRTKGGRPKGSGGPTKEVVLGGAAGREGEERRPRSATRSPHHTTHQPPHLRAPLLRVNPLLRQRVATTPRHRQRALL